MDYLWPLWRLRLDDGIKKANQAMGALKFFRNDGSVNLKAKYIIYIAIPMKLLTWDYESLALTKTLIHKLKTFYMRSIRFFLRKKVVR